MRSSRFALIELANDSIEPLKEMVNVIDQDGDGDINFHEFVWLMTR